MSPPVYQTNTRALFIEFAQKKGILLSLAGYMKYLEGEIQSTRFCHLYLTQERFASSSVAIVKHLPSSLPDTSLTNNGTNSFPRPKYI